MSYVVLALTIVTAIANVVVLVSLHRISRINRDVFVRPNKR